MILNSATRVMEKGKTEKNLEDLVPGVNIDVETKREVVFHVTEYKRLYQITTMSNNHREMLVKNYIATQEMLRDGKIFDVEHYAFPTGEQINFFNHCIIKPQPMEVSA